MIRIKTILDCDNCPGSFTIDPVEIRLWDRELAFEIHDIAYKAGWRQMPLPGSGFAKDLCPQCLVELGLSD